MAVERGASGPLPYVAMGSGPPLLFIGGLAPVAGVEWGTSERSMNRSTMLRPFARCRRVVYTNRRKQLPRGMTMADMATEHAEAIRALDRGPVDVAGMSTGGSIAQQLAADHPDLVDRLVLLSTACRIGPDGRALQRRIAARVRAGARRQAMALMTTGIVPARRGQTAAAAVVRMAPSRLLPSADDLADMAVTIEAEDTFDLAHCPTIRAPTLILAGSRDHWYSPELFAETARLIPGSRLRVFEGRGHVSVYRHPEWAGEIERFLAG